MKIGVIEDDKFSELAQQSIIFETKVPPNKDISKFIENKSLIKYNDNYYTTLENYKERNKVHDEKKIIYCTDIISQSNTLNLWLSKDREVIKADPIIDTQYLPWIESKNPDILFQRVDSEIDDEKDDKNPEIVNQDGKSASDNLKEIISKAINNDKITIKIQSIATENSPPAMILLPEQMRRINDMGAYMEQRIPGLPEYHVLLINKEHPLISRLAKLNDKKILVKGKKTKDQSLASKIANHVYDMAKLSVGGLEQKEIVNLQLNNAKLISELME